MYMQQLRRICTKDVRAHTNCIFGEIMSLNVLQVIHKDQPNENIVTMNCVIMWLMHAAFTLFSFYCNDEPSLCMNRIATSVVLTAIIIPMPSWLSDRRRRKKQWAVYRFKLQRKSKLLLTKFIFRPFGLFAIFIVTRNVIPRVIRNTLLNPRFHASD